ncbi:protein FAR1-RELATED SEQUENCE 5 [Arachis duranensis]|uniref:Protein FAR1-RELATED SEQUENCE 5 n=1 Tax=Arachis duranensis TaxID=130453 RepID=A0A6P4BXY9_ARADU|nr:protein FAR1-RELATED SEQUENCE 5 [Arachis duranensis]
MDNSPTTVVDNVGGISDAFDWLSQTVDSGGYSEDVTLDMGMEYAETTGGAALKQTQDNDNMSVKGISLTADDIIQIEFSDPKQAAHLYEEYSRVRGFGIRQGKKIRNKKGEFVQFTYLCNREGFRDKKWLQMHHRKREHKVVTRCGCPAEMRIKSRDSTGKWYVSRFVDNHNHDLLPAKFVEYLPSHRKISDVDKAHMDSMRQVGISIPKIYESIAAQAGGFNRVSFTKRDMYNEIWWQRALQNGNVNADLRALANAARIDDRMFWRYEVGVGNHMCDLFWSNGRSQEDYKLFGDVLAFDATYGRNKYNLPVIVFFGVNHHMQTCVFGTAMVSCESQSSYVWVLMRFLECMGGKPPTAVITDGDRSMRIAIQQVLPEAHHRLYAWHLIRNATANVCNLRFTSLFRHCMLADFEVEKFEMHWQAMVEECGTSDHEWVKDLYTKKSSWATAYIRGSFFAGIRTTSRCESLHAKLGRFVEKRYGVLDFVTNFQRCVDFLRDNEDELEFRSSYGTPVIQTQFPELEKSGVLCYTREIFVRYRESLKWSVRVTIVECIEADDICVYVIQKYRRPDRTWNVT